METEQGKAGKWVPPYVAFRTLQDLIERMEKEPPPPQIDPSYLDNYAGGYRGQVISALKALALIDKSNRVEQAFLDLVGASEDKRKELVGNMVRDHFADAVSLGEKNGTQGQLEELFKDKYGVTGDTRRKAIAFFLKAASYGGVKVSPHFKTPKSGTPGPRRLKRATQQGGGQATPGGGSSTGPTGTGVTVELRSGGSVTLTANVDPFTLDADDREFVFQLADKLRGYKEAESPEQDDMEEEVSDSEEA